MPSILSGWRPSSAPAAAPEPLPAVLEVEVIGAEAIAPAQNGAAEHPTVAEVGELCTLALSTAGINSGHVAVHFVAEQRIRELNREYRQHDEPTDVLSFGVDEAGPSAGPRELGDIVICPEHTADLREAIVHGALHLVGMDHETDEGEMLALQSELMRWIS